jgi:hypothetical protein
MQTLLIMGVPVIVILLVIVTLKLRELFSYLAIVGLAVMSTFTVEFLFCSVLKTQCEPDPLNSVGLIIHSFIVITICSVIYAIMPSRFKKIS